MTKADVLEVPSPADFHVHLRQGEMSELVTPHVALGGMDLAYVMPNLVPPIKSADEAMAYQASLEKLAPSTRFLVTMYLSPELTPDEIRKAAKAGVRGVKSYPRGVTTNSDGGIEDYEMYYPVFAAMQEMDMVLNLHGELPSDAEKGICVLNAEPLFLAHLEKIHRQFPQLRIVLEHATTRAAVECVKRCGDTVACSITPHHLQLIVDDWAGKPLHFCKPVAKTPDDRAALREVIREGHPRFFLGSDSAPHPLASKYPSPSSRNNSTEDLVKNCGCAAGVYTQPVLLPLCATLLESFGALDKLAGYVSENGRRFYKESATPGRTVKLRRSTEADAHVPAAYVHPASQSKADGDASKLQVMPFMAGQRLGWVIDA
ncbi:dihydroorotase [Malassezia pachydermatis]|uniref:dihydroorotase n=1 Tax=Malassezia pachydermatis TaxID=77020 RepID=A0A0M8MMZ3_9BASI|nr:dihydroorotase [Malassezia pachydermatis]KOS14828.1 dihydroorotase [Malassezia pachydermatis]